MLPTTENASASLHTYPHLWTLTYLFFVGNKEVYYAGIAFPCSLLRTSMLIHLLRSSTSSSAWVPLWTDKVGRFEQKYLGAWWGMLRFRVSGGTETRNYCVMYGLAVGFRVFGKECIFVGCQKYDTCLGAPETFLEPKEAGFG